MPLPTIANTIRATVTGTTVQGDTWVNVLHYRKDGALSYAAAIALLDPILFGLYNANIGAGTSWRTIAPTGAAIADIRYTPLDGVSATTVVSHAVAGSNATAGTGAQVAAVATLRTTLRGRSHRGRCYWGPVTSAFLTNPKAMSAAAATALAVQWNGHLTALIATGLSLVVASYLLSSATDVATVTVNTRLDTQRRRLGN